MCCFSRAVERVGDTRIFARLTGDGRQALVYAMKLSAAEPLAMILPVPTPPGSGEDAVRFVNLEGYPRLFEDLEKGFPPPPPSRGGRGRSEDSKPARLVVQRVGAFEASFVPSLADMDRLDPRFRLPPRALEVFARGGGAAAGPDYRDWGFCVFKLREGAGQEVHPMAFTFPARDADRLFFPTVHVHDEGFTPRARFDHTLYAQYPSGWMPEGAPWRESDRPAGLFVDLARAGQLIADDHCYRTTLAGELPNEDTWVRFA